MLSLLDDLAAGNQPALEDVLAIKVNMGKNATTILGLASGVLL
jgi:hypothetical protein